MGSPAASALVQPRGLSALDRRLKMAPDPALLDLPWHIPLEEWPAETLAADPDRLPEGIESGLVARGWPLLQQAVRHVGHPQIRSRGTIGGSCAHADPTAEMPVALTALLCVPVALPAQPAPSRGQCAVPAPPVPRTTSARPARHPKLSPTAPGWCFHPASSRRRTPGGLRWRSPAGASPAAMRDCSPPVAEYPDSLRRCPAWLHPG